jgi:hypothetical protein
MDRMFTLWLSYFGTLLLCTTILCPAVRAAPPALKVLQSNHMASTDGAKSAAPGSGAPTGGIEVSRHLDLRLPVEATAYAPMMESRRFAPIRGGVLGEEGGSNAAPTAGAAHPRIMGNVEAFAQRFRHEGLPVARLWENHAAMVSLGLNGKGKPGIWLVQKIH